MKHKLFIDTNVIVDFITRREPFVKQAAEIFLLIQNDKVKGYASVVTCTDLYYIISRLKSEAFSIKILKKLEKVLELLAVTPKAVQYGLSTEDFEDFEDAVQYFTALENKINYIITRNKKDFKKSQITVMDPDEYLTSFAITSKNS